MQIEDSSPTVTDTEAAAPAATTEAVVSSTPTPDVAAPSSDATQGETKESLLDAVLKVVKPSPDADKLVFPEGTAPDPSLPQSGKPDADAGATEQELSDDPSKEELDRYHSRTRKRIEKLLDQRNEARAQIDTLTSEAKIGSGLKSYLQENDIAKEDFSILLDLGSALRRGDWRTFYAGIRPYVDLAEEALGVTIPADLQQRVQQGHMTTEAARGLSQERYARLLAEQHAERATQQVTQRDQQFAQAQQAQVQAAVQTAVSAWEASVRQTDPDYGHKQDAVKNLLWAVVNERGAPQSPEQAVEIAKEAYRRANEMVTKLAPRPKATQAVPSAVHRSPGASPEPKSMMEAAMQGLAKSRQNA